MKDKNGKELTNKEIVEKVNNRLQNIALEFGILCLHLIGNVPSHTIRRFFYRLAGVKIGQGSSLHTRITFYKPENISIGEDTIVGENTVLDGRDKLIIGNHVDIASEVMIYNSQHDVNDENFSAIEKPVIIKDYVFIGPRAIILPGVTIEKGAIVAAGAVVTKDVSDFSIVGGVPAQVIGQRKLRDLHYKLGRARWFR